MENTTHIIQTNRLDLVLLDSKALQYSLAGDIGALQSSLGVEVPLDWFEAKELIELRYEQIRREPEYQPWSLRAVTLRDKGKMIGHIGFHARPGASYLHSFAPNGVEFGYSIYPAFRRNGYAREAAFAVMEWAFRQHSVTEFILSISPDNMPSLRLAQGLGFNKIGSYVDEEEGIEDIYLLDYLRV